MLTRIGLSARAWARAVDPFTSVVGLARTLIALSTAGTLAFSRVDSLFRPAVGIPDAPRCGGARAAALFCAAPSLEVARWLAIALLLVVASGWRPRITGVVHYWVNASLATTAIAIDGGDQIACDLALLLVPVTLMDGREWHWSRAPAPAPGIEGDIRLLIARSALLACRVQVAGLYLHAALGKLAVEEWVDGTAIHYWTIDPMMGSPAWLVKLLEPLLLHPSVALVTWGVLALELALAMGLWVSPARRKYLLWGGLALHGSILFLHGLVSFVLIMFGALVLYLRPVDQAFDLRGIRLPWRRPRLATSIRPMRALQAASQKT